MARERRCFSSQDCYHVVLRGKDTICLFQDEQDVREFEYLLDMKLEELPEVGLDCFYIGKDHFHGILYGKQQEVTKFCSKVIMSYAWSYKHRYQHEGAVFQKRFLSEPIEGKKDYERVAHYIEHHKKRDSWRFDSQCQFDKWQEELYECPVVLDIPNDLHRQKVTIFSRVARKKMEEMGVDSRKQLMEDRQLWGYVQKEAKRFFGSSKDFKQIVNDFLQSPNVLAP